jgi:poly(hydroxyalkanoate) depolymerase family esterase
MKSDFVAEILRATGTLRAGDPAGATAIIQAARAAGGLRPGGDQCDAAGEGSTHARSATDPVIEGTVIRHPANLAEAPPRRSPHGRKKRPLGEVLRTLRDGRRRIGRDGAVRGRPAPAPEIPLPEGAEFRDLTFACAAGARGYRLYVPASASNGLGGLIVMLHGCTQSPEDFAAGTRMNDLAEEHRLLVAYPAQTGAENAMSCWNWFRPGDQARGSGEPAIIAGLTESLRDSFTIRRDRVFVAGLSAGGAMAAVMGETYPELYAGVGVHSGLACGSASDVASAFGAMRGQGRTGRPAGRLRGERRPRLIVFHGGADATVHPSNADAIVARHGDGGPPRSDRFPSGSARGYTRTVSEGADGTAAWECWMVEGAQHAWSGGSARGSYTDPDGPDASRAMVRFFLFGSSDG